MDSATGGSGTRGRAYYLEFIPSTRLNSKKDDFRLEIVFFDIPANTISCGWCKLVYSSLILFVKTL